MAVRATSSPPLLREASREGTVEPSETSQHATRLQPRRLERGEALLHRDVESPIATQLHGLLSVAGKVLPVDEGHGHPCTAGRSVPGLLRDIFGRIEPAVGEGDVVGVDVIPLHEHGEAAALGHLDGAPVVLSVLVAEDAPGGDVRTQPVLVERVSEEQHRLELVLKQLDGFELDI